MQQKPESKNIVKPFQVINRGDSFKRKERGGPPISRPSIEISVDGCPEERVPRHFEKVYRVVFLGCTEVSLHFNKKLRYLIASIQVGKTSIIDQFMSSEHADVYVDNFVCPEAEDREVRYGSSIIIDLQQTNKSSLVFLVLANCKKGPTGKAN